MIASLLPLPAAAMMLTLASSCPAPPAPKVAVHVNTKEPTQSFKRKEEMGSMHIHTSAEMQSFVKQPGVFVGGVTVSNIVPDAAFAFRYEQGCLSVSHLELALNYAPHIYIAADYAQGSCLFIQTWTHELKHVAADVKTLEEFQPYLQEKLEDVASLPPIGPIDPQDIDKAKALFTEQIGKTLQAAIKRMEYNRIFRQESVDNLETKKYHYGDCSGVKF